jgi:hypothetical protein
MVSVGVGSNMSMEEDVALLTEYNEWKVSLKTQPTPEEFIVWRAKEQAFNKLNEIVEWLECEFNDGDEWLDVDTINSTTHASEVVEGVRNIIGI